MGKKTLVIGASLNSSSYANLAIKRLVMYGHEVAAIGMHKGEVAGILIDTEFRDLKAVDTVSLYLNPEKQKAFYDYIVGLRPHRVIFNPGTENPEFYNILTANKIAFEVACNLTLLATNQY